GDPAAAIDELNRLVASVDGLGVPDPKANKVAALTNVVVIATHTRNRAAAEQALTQLEPLLMQQADEAGNPAFKRGQQAQIAYLEGWTAARRGDYASAQKQADRITQLLAPDANPRKLEPMHQLVGFIALYQGKYNEAAAHLRQGNLLDPYIKYQLAVAMHGVSRWSNFPKNSRNRCHRRPRAASAAPRSRVVVSSPARMLPATFAPNRSRCSIRGNICATNQSPRSARNAFRPNDRSSSISSTAAPTSPSPTAARRHRRSMAGSIPIPATSGQ